MILQTNSHIEVVSQFAELILHNRIHCPQNILSKPNRLNFIFQKSSHQVFEQLQKTAQKMGILRTIAMEICFFLQNSETYVSHLVESWIINVQIPNNSTKVIVPIIDDRQSHKQIILQSRAISSILMQTPLFQKLMSLVPETQESKKTIGEYSLIHKLSFCPEKTEYGGMTGSNCFEIILPHIPIFSTTGLLQIKVKYICLNYTSKIDQKSLKQNLNQEEYYQNHPTQSSSNLTMNSDEFKEPEFSVPKKSLRKGSMQPENVPLYRDRTKSFSNQMLVYSKREDIEMLMLAEQALMQFQSTDYELEYQMIQEEQICDKWQFVDSARMKYKNTEIWKLVQEKKNQFQKYTKQCQKYTKSKSFKSQLEKTYDVIMEY